MELGQNQSIYKRNKNTENKFVRKKNWIDIYINFWLLNFQVSTNFYGISWILRSLDTL